jgi:hypothetical protein
MIYDFTRLAHKSGFDLSKSTTRQQLQEFTKLVILDVCETLEEKPRQEVLLKFRVKDDPKA